MYKAHVDWNLRALLRLKLIPAVVVAAVLVPARHSAAEESIAGEVAIETTGLRPQVLMTEPERRVTFANRSGRMVHLDFIRRDSEPHHVFQVPDRIWAVLHRPGRHPYAVHFLDARVAELRGVVEVAVDPHGRPDPVTCTGVTVTGGCLER